MIGGSPTVAATQSQRAQPVPLTDLTVTAYVSGDRDTSRTRPSSSGLSRARSAGERTGRFASVRRERNRAGRIYTIDAVARTIEMKFRWRQYANRYLLLVIIIVSLGVTRAGTAQERVVTLCRLNGATRESGLVPWRTWANVHLRGRGPIRLVRVPRKPGDTPRAGAPRAPAPRVCPGAPSGEARRRSRARDGHYLSPCSVPYDAPGCARSSRMPRPVFFRRSMRNVTPSPYPTAVAICSIDSFVVRRR